MMPAEPIELTKEEMLMIVDDPNTDPPFILPPEKISLLGLEEPEAELMIEDLPIVLEEPVPVLYDDPLEIEPIGDCSVLQ